MRRSTELVSGNVCESEVSYLLFWSSLVTASPREFLINGIGNDFLSVDNLVAISLFKEVFSG